MGALKTCPLETEPLGGATHAYTLKPESRDIKVNKLTAAHRPKSKEPRETRGAACSPHSRPSVPLMQLMGGSRRARGYVNARALMQ